MKKIMEFIIKQISNIVRSTRIVITYIWNLLRKSIFARIVLFIITILVFLFLYRRTILHKITLINQGFVLGGYYDDLSTSTKKKQNRMMKIKEYKKEITEFLQDSVDDYRMKCVSKHITEYINMKTENNTKIVSIEEIEQKEKSILGGVCDNNTIYKYIVEDFNIDISQETIMNTSKKNKERKEVVRNKTKEKEVVNFTKAPTKEQYAAIPKYRKAPDNAKKVKIKALFCDIGHGMGKKWKDPGKVRYFTKDKDNWIVDILPHLPNSEEQLKNGFIRERDIAIKNGTQACGKVLDYIKKENLAIDFHLLGMSDDNINDRNKYINKVSQRDGLSWDNSILVSFHANSVAINDKMAQSEINRRKNISQSLVLYSDVYNTISQGEGKRFADHILSYIVSARGKAKKGESDKSTTRAPFLAMTHGNRNLRKKCAKGSSDHCISGKSGWYEYPHRPLSVLIELGFMTNRSDLEEISTTDTYINSISNSLISYIQKRA